jgi:hypothetical protein
MHAPGALAMSTRNKLVSQRDAFQGQRGFVQAVLKINQPLCGSTILDIGHFCSPQFSPEQST